MTSQQFIEKWHGVADGKERINSSIYKDGRGVIYSYGLHYPLLFTVNGVNFVNTRGYSITTSKHISWAWSAINYNAVGVELDHQATEAFRRFGVTDDDRLAEIKRCLDDKQTELKTEIAGKKRKDTWVYQDLTNRLFTVTNHLNKLAKIGV